VEWAIPGLNTRETALVVWVGGLLLLALKRREVRSSFAALFKLVVTSVFLGGVIFGAVAYATATVLLLRRFGYWESDMTRVAILWFFGFALIALFNTRNVDPRYFRRLVLHNLGLAVVVEFVTNLHTFPLPVELVLVPMALLLVAVQAYSEGKPEFAPGYKLAGWFVTVLGLLSVGYSISYLVRHFGEVATAEKIEEFFLPLVLTACFVPFLIAIRYMTVWQTMLHMIRFGLDDNDDLYRFTRRSILRTCGPHLGKAQLFEADFRGRLWGARSERDVSAVLEQFRLDWQRGRRVKADAKPPEV
jgi:hypothetical protein